MLLRKATALMLALILCLCLVPAHAETEYPPRPEGAVLDLAGVLGEKTIQDLEALNEKTQSAANGRLYVLTRHFLGGQAVQKYAEKVFEVWNLEKGDALLLMVIGEESFALALGADAKKALPTETSNTLLGAFRNTFKARQYDSALADLSVDLGKILAKAAGKNLDTAGLFGETAIQSTPQPQTVDDYWYGMFAREDYDARENDDNTFWTDWQNKWHYEETRINWRSVIIWGLVIYFLFFRRKRRRNRR